MAKFWWIGDRLSKKIRSPDSVTEEADNMKKAAEEATADVFLAPVDVDPAIIAKLTIAWKGTTPKVSYDPIERLLLLEGKCIPEDAEKFWKPIIAAINELPENWLTSITLDIEYFNTATSKQILDLFREINKFSKFSPWSITIFWHYPDDDEDMLEAGEDYESIIQGKLDEREDINLEQREKYKHINPNFKFVMKE